MNAPFAVFTLAAVAGLATVSVGCASTPSTPSSADGGPPASATPGNVPVDGTPTGDAGTGTPTGDAGAGTPTGDAGTGTPTVDAGTGTPTVDAGTPACTTKTYANFGQTFFGAKCMTCHAVTRPGLGSHAAIRANLQNVTSQISSGRMPKGLRLTETEKSDVLGWLSCGAP